MGRGPLAALGVVALLAAAGGAPARALLSLTQVDVSKRTGAQLEPTIAVSPDNPAVLLAGSNDVTRRSLDTLAYTSTDGGASWVTSHPYADRGCAIGDPATAIGADGRELVSYLVAPCRTRSDDNRTSVYVSRRRGPSGPWAAVRVARPLRIAANDKPTLVWDTAAASRYAGRAYVAWSRIRRVTDTTLVVAHSDDAGATWSKPVRIESPAVLPSDLFASLAIAPSGDVYAAWTNVSHAVFVARSSDGGESFGPAATVQSDTFFASVCYFLRISTPVPAQSRRCVTTTPTVVASRTGVTVVYARPAPNGRGLAGVARSYDRLLTARHKARRVNPPDGKVASDQFEPVAALDPRSGLIWVCFYDTKGDPARQSVRFSCTASTNGIRWRAPRPVASVRSNETRAPATRFQYGDYQGLAVGRDGVAHPVWTDSRDLQRRGEEIYTTALTVDELGH